MLIRRSTTLPLAVLAASLSLLSACGAEQPMASETKIIGGEDVKADQNDARRWSTVALTTDVSRSAEKPAALDRGGSFCTGTVISDRVIVTAAHCLQAFDPETKEKLDEFILPEEKDFLVFFGTKVDRKGDWIRAAHVIPHPEWDPSETLNPQPTKAANDIGLIILSDAIPAAAKPVAIADESVELGQGGEIHLAGFGVTKSRETDDTGTLRQVTTTVQAADANIARVTVGEFFKGACAGDSGGPAYVDVGGELQLVGATSTGAELFGQCLGLMNNYTDVRHYKSWIQETIGQF